MRSRIFQMCAESLLRSRIFRFSRNCKILTHHVRGEVLSPSLLRTASPLVHFRPVTRTFIMFKSHLSFDSSLGWYRKASLEPFDHIIQTCNGWPPCSLLVRPLGIKCSTMYLFASLRKNSVLHIVPKSLRRSIQGWTLGFSLWTEGERDGG